VKYALWIVSGLLAAMFLFAGGMKLVMPAELLAEQAPLPVLFVRVIGLAEVLGAIGLILPAALRIRPGLTIVAAVELAHVMVAAALLTAAMGDPASANVPVVVGALAAFVAIGRYRQQTTRTQTVRPLVLQPAA
jgi:hypothetical protein